MNKRKVITLVVTVLLISLVCLGVYKVRDAKQWDPVENVVESFLDGYKNNEKDINQYLMEGIESDEIEYTKHMKLFTKDIDYNIKGHYTEGDNYFIETEITNIDIKKLIEQAAEQAKDIGKLSSSDEMIKSFTESKEKPMKTFDVDIQLVNINGKYLIVNDQYFANALYGGLNEFVAEMIKE